MTAKTEKIKCGIYARDSTDKQGDTIEHQIMQGQEHIRRLGDEYDAENVYIFKDHATSGYYSSVFDREAMKEAVALAKEKKFGLILFKEVSRVGRDKQENPAIVGIFEQYGIRVIAINDNYDSKNKDNITFGILSVLAEQESVKTSVRVSTGKQMKARKGQWNGEAPLGFKVDSQIKKLVVDEEVRDIIETVFDLYVNHRIGTFTIAKRLNQSGKRTNEGNLFSREPVRRILTNPAYIGHTVYGKRKNRLHREYDDSGRMTKKKVQERLDPKHWVTIEDTHEAIISKELFYEAQRILAEKGHHRAPRRAYHPLTGVLFCSLCGEGMVCQKRSYNAKDYRYYICKTYHKYGREACPQANINADTLEPAIVSVVKSRLLSLSESTINTKLNRSSDIARLEKELSRRQKSKEKAQKDQMDLFSQREIFSEDAYHQQMITLRDRANAAEIEMDVLQKQIAAIHESENESANIVELTKRFLALDVADMEEVRTLLHSLIERITVKGENVDIKYIYDIM